MKFFQKYPTFVILQTKTRQQFYIILLDRSSEFLSHFSQSDTNGMAWLATYFLTRCYFAEKNTTKLSYLSQRTKNYHH